ncbi:MAG: hypothetical protein IJY01_06625 [Clostridia bacterium]|nr:hypothetical protein [Clostridia bacterium]
MYSIVLSMSTHPPQAVPLPSQGKALDVNGCYLRIVMETRNFEHIEQIKNALKENGFRIVG